MLTTNTIKFYNSIKMELTKMNDILEFMNNNNPVKERKEILSKFLTSESSVNGANVIYSVQRVGTNGETLKREYINRFNQFKKEFNMKEFYGLIATSKNEIYKLFEEYNYSDKNVISLLEKIEKIADLYQEVIQSDDGKVEVVNLFNEMQECCIEFETTINAIDGFVGSLTNNKEVEITSKNTMELQLLNVEFNLGEFGSILSKLNESYNLIASLNKVEYTKLKIVKVESGSLLSILLGDENILEVLALILKRIADSIYHKYTKDGKLELNANIMKDIAKNADILESLEKCGIDTTKSKRNLTEVLDVVTKDLHEIVTSSPKINLNGEEIIACDERLLIEYKTKLLTSNPKVDNKE